jgi:hypothetical protein
VIKQDTVDVHRVVNILELVLTEILEGDAEPAETGLRVFLHAARHADTASFRQRFQPGRDVDAIAVDASAFDNIADVDPHPEFDPSIWRYLRIPLDHCPLDLHGTTQGVHGTDEQDQQAVASSPYEPTAVFFNLGFNKLSMVSVQLGQSAFIVDAYQAAVPGYIRHQDCHKSAFYFLTGHS